MKAAISIPDRHSPARHSVERACLAEFLSRGSRSGGHSASSICEQLFPADEIARQYLPGGQRAAVAAATTTAVGWAKELAGDAVGEFIGGLAPGSAAARLISRGTQVSFEGVNTISLPVRPGGPIVAGWVGEGLPIAARQDTFATISLGPPKKMAMIVALSRELASHPSAAKVFRQMLMENAALSLDGAYFSAIAGDAASHVGLLAGVTAIAGATLSGGATPEQIAGDLGVLAAAANSSPGSSGTTAWIMTPALAAQSKTAVPELSDLIWPSGAIPSGRIVAVDAASLVHGFGPEPDISSSIHSTIHMSDTPTAIGTAGSPNVVAAPSQSMFQQGKIALRLLVDVAFAKRRAGCVAFADNVVWAAS